MKASELIKELEELITEHGDLDVIHECKYGVHECHYGYIHDLSSIYLGLDYEGEKVIFLSDPK